MSYFPVDDQAAFHPKFISAGNAAIGLWTRAGSYCKQHTTGGFVATDIALALGKKNEIDALLRVGLWTSAEDGYQFHDWSHQAGNGTAQEEKTRREAEREQGRIRAQRARDKKNASNGMSNAVTHTITPPDITGEVRTIPVPVPLTKDTHVHPELNRDGTATDDQIPSMQSQALAGLGITNLHKIKLAIGKHAGRAVTDQAAISVALDLLDKGGDGIKSPQGYVLGAIAQSWPEVQKILDEVAA